MLYWGGTATMGCHIQLQGKYLQKLSDRCELLGDILRRNGKITRLDLAIDTTEVSCASDIYRAYELGELKTRAQNVMRIESLS
jgi:DNA relaxase NicK